MGRYWNPKWERLARILPSVDWENFRKNAELIQHIENPTDDETLHQASRIHEDFDILPRDMRDSLVGRPRTEKFLSVHVTRASVAHARMALKIREFSKLVLDWNRSIDIVEIGGGFGGLAWMLCRYLPVSHYTFVDHAALLKIQARFVDGMLTDPELVLKQPRPAFAYVRADEWQRFLRPGPAIVVNTRSMMEMDWQEIHAYFDWISKNLRSDGFFYSMNRVEKVTRMEDWPWEKLEVVWKGDWPSYMDFNPMCEVFARRKR